MQQYIGTKIIQAEPAVNNENEEGYSVTYPDGYKSWSPKDAFEEAYRPSNAMPFGLAVEAMKKGLKVARAGWNGKGMWLILVPGSPSIKPVAGTPYSNAGLTEPTNINAHVDMYTAQGEMQPGWLASQTDMLADDWLIID